MKQEEKPRPRIFRSRECWGIPPGEARRKQPAPPATESEPDAGEPLTFAEHEELARVIREFRERIIFGARSPRKTCRFKKDPAWAATRELDKALDKLKYALDGDFCYRFPASKAYPTSPYFSRPPEEGQP